MKPTHLLLFVLFAFSLSCRNGNETEVTPDPCLDPNYQFTSADFDMFELPYPLDLTPKSLHWGFRRIPIDSTDQPFLNFIPKDIEADSFRWSIGRSVFTQKELYRFSFLTRVEGDDIIPITLEVWRKKENRKCSKDSGYAKLTKNLIFVDYPQSFGDECGFQYFPNSYGIFEGYINNDPNLFRRVEINFCSPERTPSESYHLSMKGLIPIAPNETDILHSNPDGRTMIYGFKQFSGSGFWFVDNREFVTLFSSNLSKNRDSIEIVFDTINDTQKKANFDRMNAINLNYSYRFSFKGRRVQ